MEGPHASSSGLACAGAARSDARGCTPRGLSTATSEPIDGLVGKIRDTRSRESGFIGTASGLAGFNTASGLDGFIGEIQIGRAHV